MSKFKLDADESLPSLINSANPHDGCDYQHLVEYELNGPGEEFIHLIRVEDLGEFPDGLDLTNKTDGEIKGTVRPLDEYHEIQNYILREIASKPDSATPWPHAYETEADIGNPDKLLTVGFLKSFEGQHYTGKTWATKGHLAYGRDGLGELTKFYFTLEIKSIIQIPAFEESDDGNMKVILDEDELIFEVLEGGSTVAYADIQTETDYDVKIYSNPLYEPVDPETYSPVAEVIVEDIKFQEVPGLEEGEVLPVDGLTIQTTIINRRQFFIQPVPAYDPEVFVRSYGESNKNLKDDDGNVLTGQEYVDWRKSQGHKYPKKC